MKEIARYSGCFVCGQKNEIGLKARFYWDGSKAISEVTASELYSGYKDIFHGGITSTMLDEVMIKAILAQDINVVTAEMTIRFKQPVYIGDQLRFEGKLTGQKGPLFLTEGKAINQKGEIVALAKGKYVRPAEELSDKLLLSLEK